jgi:hypothetical protein
LNKIALKKKYRKNSEISDNDSDTTALEEVNKEINNKELLQIYNEEIHEIYKKISNDILVKMYNDANDNTNTNHNNNNNNNNNNNHHHHLYLFPSFSLPLSSPPSQTFDKFCIFCYERSH